MRICAAIFGSFLPLFVYCIILEMKGSVATAALGGILVLFDNLNLLESRLILIDSQLMFWSALALLVALKWWNHLNRHNDGINKLAAFVNGLPAYYSVSNIGSVAQDFGIFEADPNALEPESIHGGPNHVSMFTSSLHELKCYHNGLVDSYYTNIEKESVADLRYQVEVLDALFRHHFDLLQDAAAHDDGLSVDTDDSQHQPASGTDEFEVDDGKYVYAGVSVGDSDDDVHTDHEESAPAETLIANREAPVPAGLRRRHRRNSVGTDKSVAVVDNSVPESDKVQLNDDISKSSSKSKSNKKASTKKKSASTSTAASTVPVHTMDSALPQAHPSPTALSTEDVDTSTHQSDSNHVSKDESTHAQDNAAYRSPHQVQWDGKYIPYPYLEPTALHSAGITSPTVLAIAELYNQGRLGDANSCRKIIHEDLVGSWLFFAL